MQHGILFTKKALDIDNYICTFEYPDVDFENNYNKLKYIVECIYRYCSFSGTRKAPRNFSDFHRKEPN